ncbi:MAG: D-glycero-beta-D-manno-heptose 1-phosphate adenylyltransferase [Nanoarchaeota archaeon]|nr:D-glycero-beta-D-manno-heptose 1-phosphate adenylyltransferase [Nanoarchaeota archaeon]MBU1029905.1 D-glycero-beta-D-manno-heptose 1-phosphate adenylyltransferase [Nanoarchaeota archaeon]MBU1849828.1 D-glycero-beta-D-manno-heptose 1-phosphate adenylyltransferase [Nanoarchaeota archaeon]
MNNPQYDGVSTEVLIENRTYEAFFPEKHAAGIVVSKSGTAVVTNEELINIFKKENSKIKTKDEISKISKSFKKKGKTVVFTNGCFDILHVGHVRLLEKCKMLGDFLIIGFNTDNSIRKLKGINRPIINENERAEMLAALTCVDYIVFFNENNPSDLIKKIKPTIQAKGEDYSNKPMPERKIVEKYGGKVILIPLEKGFSTTNIIERINNKK